MGRLSKNQFAALIDLFEDGVVIEEILLADNQHGAFIVSDRIGGLDAKATYLKQGI